MNRMYSFNSFNNIIQITIINHIKENMDRSLRCGHLRAVRMPLRKSQDPILRVFDHHWQIQPEIPLHPLKGIKRKVGRKEGMREGKGKGGRGERRI